MLARVMVPAPVGDVTAADWRVLNRANWDDRVPVHLASRFCDLEGFRKTRDSLRKFEPAEAGDVRGKDLEPARIGVICGVPACPEAVQAQVP